MGSESIVQGNDSNYHQKAERSMRRTLAVHELFQERARANPDSLALLAGERKLTYREVNQRANRLARRLQACGVGHETLVGLCLERSPEAVIAMLAIIKAGGAYVPLDPEYPDERLDFMLKDTGAPVVVTQRRLAQRVAGQGLELILAEPDRGSIGESDATDLNVRVGGESLIYVMYTSGSSGRPKGVMIEHHSVARLVTEPNYVSLDASHRCLMLAPISFDASTFEIWGALLNGASLLIAPPGTLSLKDTGRLIERFGVTTLWLTAALFNLMIDEEPRALGSLRQLLSGGDAGSAAHFRRALDRSPGCRLINGYGPTESTTFAACATVRAEDLSAGPVPIGFPLSGTQIWLLDESMNPVQWGETGELCIGGEGLMRGYLNRPELDRRRFVTPGWAPFASMRLYRTGDLARYREDGALEMLGRVDDQVKIAGYRVEPGETTFWLREHPAVRDAMVVADTSASGEPRLIAYLVVRAGQFLLPPELRKFLSKHLPNFMLPAEFVMVDTLPLSPNGKVDRAGVTGVHQPTVVQGNTAGQTDVEAAIRGVWMEVLGADSVGILDNFFDLGGDSLKLLEVHSKLSRRLGEIELVALFEYPTVAALAEYLRTGGRRESDDIDARAVRQRTRLQARTASARVE